MRLHLSSPSFSLRYCCKRRISFIYKEKKLKRLADATKICIKSITLQVVQITIRKLLRSKMNSIFYSKQLGYLPRLRVVITYSFSKQSHSYLTYAARRTCFFIKTGETCKKTTQQVKIRSFNHSFG